MGDTGIIFDTADSMSTRKKANEIGDPTAAPVLSAISDTNAELDLLAARMEKADAELKKILEVTIDPTDPHEAAAMAERLEQFMWKHFDSPTPDVYEELMEPDKVKGTVDEAFEIFKRDSAARVASGKLTSERRLRVATEVQSAVEEFHTQYSTALQLRGSILARTRDSLLETQTS